VCFNSGGGRPEEWLSPRALSPFMRRANPEIEFLDIVLIKDSSLLVPAVHCPFYWRILNKTILFSGFKNSYEKIRETRILESIHDIMFAGKVDPQETCLRI
jgi:hypothetical protein